jgi:valyl-tRNA synthetase
MMNIGDGFVYSTANIKIADLNLADKWILTELNQAIQKVNENFEGYFFSEATSIFYKFWIESFCDVYLEYSKFALKSESRALLTKTIL